MIKLSTSGVGTVTPAEKPVVNEVPSETPETPTDNETDTW